MYRELVKINRRPGSIRANEFLSNVLESVCKLNDKMGHKLTEYAQDGGNYPDAVDHPLMYGERGLYSLFAASLVKISDATISEVPHKRRAQNARVDFWSMYNGDPYIIELKRRAISLGYDCFNNCVPEWNSLKKQIEEARHYDESANYLGILVLYLYSGRKDKHRLNKTGSHNDVVQEIRNNAQFRPDYLGVWEPKEEWKKYAAIWDDKEKPRRYEVNYGVLFLTHVKLAGDD